MLIQEFGDLLTQGFRSIAAREHKAILALEDELGYEMDVTRWSIEKWRHGNVPRDLKKVDHLARVCVHRGGMDKQWLLHFLTLGSFHGKEALVQELFPGDSQASFVVHHNLPRRPYDTFVGREKELAELERFLSPHHRLGVICLSGIAGVGKTTLALEIAHRWCEKYNILSPNERFEAFVWVTAKAAELLPTGPTSRIPTFTDLYSLYRAIAEVLDLPAITRAVTVADREVIVTHALAERRILLVLDNLEDIEDSLLKVFLRDLPTPSKAIVTTRHRIDVAVPIQVQAFNEADACELIHLECQRYSLSLTLEQTEKLLRRTGHLPLAIVRTMGRMAWRGSSVEAEIRKLGSPIDDIYDFCFERSNAPLRDHDAHKLFMALALFSSDATLEALGYVAGFREDILDRDEALSDLEVLSLVNKEGDRFSLEPLTKVKALAELAANPNFEHEACNRWLEWYQRLALQIEETTNFTNHKVEISNLKNVIDWLLEQKRMDEVSWLFQRTRKFFFAVGRWGALVRLATQVANWAEIVDNTGLLADALESLTDVFLWHADFARGKEWFDRIQQLATRLNNELLQAEVWLNQVKIFCHQPTSSHEEIETVLQALEIFRRHGKTERIVDALNTLGNLHLKQRQLGEALGYYQEGLQVLALSASQTPEVQRLHACLRGNLGHVAGFKHHFAEACDILREVLKDFTDQSDLAEAYASLALYKYYLGLGEQAHQFRQKADRIIKQLNMKRPICPEDGEWDQLPR